MGQWIIAWLRYWQALYVRGAALLVCVALGLAVSIIFGIPALLMLGALGVGVSVGLGLVAITIFPVVVGTTLRIFHSNEALKRPPSLSIVRTQHSESRVN